jgi:hypothetical protein
MPALAGSIGDTVMDLKQLHAADRIRYALSGKAILTGKELQDAITAEIVKVERATNLSKSARARGYNATAKLWDAVADNAMDKALQLFDLPTVDNTDRRQA